MSDPCPDPSVLDQLLGEALSVVEEQRLDAHLLTCAACRRILEVRTSLDWGTHPVTVAAATAGHAWSVLGPPAPARSAPAPAPAVAPGPALTGYERLERLGGGSSGEVYRAIDRRLGRVVALKLPRFGPDPGAVERERFRREGQVLARLNDPGLVTVYEVGESDGVPYLAMEYVEGPTLSRATLGQPQPVGRSAWVCERLARALQQAHEAGLVHRDLKPANVLLQRSGGAADQGSRNGVGSEPPSGPTGSLWGTPRIIDFGLAKDLRSVDDLTLERDILGTPGYMAPEQARGRHGEVGPATDVYGLGAILYELLTGRPPYREADPLQTLLAVSFGEPVSIDRLRGGVPRDLVTICAKCLEKEPRRRYGSALDLAEDLRRFREGYPITARPPGAWGRTVRWVRREPARAGLIGLGTLVVATLAIGGPLVAVREAARAHQEAERARQFQALQEDALAQATLAREQRDRAHDNFEMAREVVSDISELLQQGRSIFDDRPTDLEVNLHGVTERFQDRFAIQESTDPAVVLDQADGLVRRAILSRQLADPDAWRRNIDRALASFEAVDRRGELPLGRRYFWIVALFERADVLLRQKEPFEAARALQDRALALAEELHQSDPAQNDWFLLWARLQIRRCATEPEGSERIRRVQAVYDAAGARLARRGPSEDVEAILRNSGVQLGSLLCAMDQPHQAVPVFRDAYQRFEAVRRAQPRSATVAAQFSSLAQGLATALERTGQPDAAAEVLDRVFTLLLQPQGVDEVLPTVVIQSLVTATVKLHLQRGDFAGVERTCRIGMPLTRSDAPHAWLEWNLARALAAQGRFDEAVGLAEGQMRRMQLPAVWMPDFARVLVLASEALRHPTDPATPPEPDRADRYDARAVAWLERALTAPGRPVDVASTRARIRELDWSTLRGRDDFAALVRRQALDGP